MPSPRLGTVTVLAVALLAAVVQAFSMSESLSDERAPESAPAAEHDRLVATQPHSATPAIEDGTVYAILELGDKVIVGGTFTQVTSRRGESPVDRPYLFAFDRATGTVDPDFRPSLNGEVQALYPGPTEDSVYVAGRFNTVNGAKQRGLALLSTTDGSRYTGFAPPAFDGPVYDVVRHPSGRLLVGGTFTRVGSAVREGLASLHPTTGALDDYLTVRLAGHHNWDEHQQARSAVGARRLALSPDGGRLVVIGNFRTANGMDRDQIVVLSTGSESASVSSWQTSSFSSTCNPRSFDHWVRDVAYSPDGSYFVVAAAGGVYPGTLCDTASRWEANASGAGQRPTWVAASGGDTLLSAAVTGHAVYIGGHFRWLNNPQGRDEPEPGAIGRASIAALDPANGLPLTWNPGRNPRGFGVTELYATSSGLWLGYDTNYLGNFQYRRQRIGFFPLSGGSPVPPSTTRGVPGKLYLAAEGNTVNELRVRQYDGPKEVGASARVSAPSDVDWRNVRGAFWVGGDLFYGDSSGKLWRRSFDGSEWGAASLVDPYHDNDGVAPDWDEVSTGSGETFAGAYPDFYGTELASVTGMFYANGRLYYTRSDSSALYWRWFTPSSGAVGAQRFTAASSGFSDVAGGLFTSDGYLYVSRTNGNLYRLSFSGGAPSGQQVAVSGPNVDGHTWRARAIFPAP